MSRSTAPRIVVLAGLVLLSVVKPPDALAQGTGVVEVASGDRIRGDVRRLEHGRLDLRTPRAAPGAERWAGTISIVWSEITLIASSDRLEVELVSGEVIVGTIETPQPRRMLVQTASGPSALIDMNDVVRIVPMEHGFRARTTGEIGFGFVLTRDTRTYSLNGDALHRSLNHAYETQIGFASWLLSQEDTDHLTRNSVKVDVRRRLPNRWYAVAKGEATQDDELELDARLLAGGGVGRRLIQSNRHELRAEGGFDYDGDRFTGTGAFDHSAEAFAGINWNWFEPGHSMDAEADATTFFGLTRSRFRLEVDASVRREVLSDIYWSVKVFEDFDSDPPDARPRSNVGVTFLIGWTF
jgi:hypothetical protein